MADCCIKTNVNLKEFKGCAADRQPIGVINQEKGATITRMGMAGKMETVEANAGDKLFKGDIVKTPPDGSVAITLADKSVVSGGPNSTIDIGKFDVNNTPNMEGQGRRGSVSDINGKVVPIPADQRSSSPVELTLGVRG